MKWHKKLYCGTSITQPGWTKFQISFNKKSKGYYCIALSNQKDTLLDIYESQFLRTTNLDTHDLYIIGIAGSKTEAYDVVRDIIEDVYMHTRSYDIKSFLAIE